MDEYRAFVEWQRTGESRMLGVKLRGVSLSIMNFTYTSLGLNKGLQDTTRPNILPHKYTTNMCFVFRYHVVLFIKPLQSPVCFIFRNNSDGLTNTHTHIHTCTPYKFLLIRFILDEYLRQLSDYQLVMKDFSMYLFCI